MIHFKKLRVSGFKSFVDPAELLIEPGMTGIVGPNGCGKSNLVEALRWVMGETSARQMRGGEMDDLVFNGASHRPPRPYAEVTLLLDNSQGDAPAFFNAGSEIEISRRLVRGEGSIYRCNGKEVRARDVQLLFADLATGARSTAMVSQGRVGLLIDAKPVQRRSLLEEAAGIAGLHARRHEAEARLNAAEANLQRLADVLGALETQLSSLRRQVRQAQRYRTVAEAIRTTEAMLLALRWKTASKALEEAQNRRSRSEVEATALEAAAAAAAAEQILVRQTLPDLRQAAAETAAALHRLAIAQERLEAEEKRQAEARMQAERDVQRIASDAEREQALLEEAATTLAGLEEERRLLEDGRRDEGPALEEAQQRVVALAARVETQEAEMLALTERVAAFDAARADARRRTEEAETRIEQLTRRLQEAEDAVAAARTALDGNDAQVAGEQAAMLESRVETLAEERAVAEEKEGGCREALECARKTLQAEKAVQIRLQAEIQALEAVLAQVDGSGASALDRLKVAPGYEQALGAVLGEALSFPLAEDAPAAASSWLTLPPLLDGPLLPSEAFPLADAVRAPGALQRALGVIGVVEKEEQGQALRLALRPGQALATREGAVWRWDGLTMQAGAPTPTARRLQEKKRLDVLRVEAAESGVRVGVAEERYERMAAAAAAAKNALEELRVALRSAETDLMAARAAYAETARQIDAAETRLAAAQAQAKTLDVDLTEARSLSEEARRRENDLPLFEDMRAALEERRAALGKSRSALAEARSSFDRLERDAADRRHRLRLAGEERERWRRRKEGAAAQQKALAERRQAAVEAIEALAERPLTFAEERARLTAKLEDGEIQRRFAADRLAEAELRSMQADAALREAEKAASTGREDLVRTGAAVEQRLGLLEQAETQIRERLHCTPAHAWALAGLDASGEFAPLEEVETRLHRLLGEREGMGPVNLRAEQEMAALEEQNALLSIERDDLTTAIARLRQGISELNSEGRQRLLASFEQVDAHFRRLFVRLFGGGRAHLALTESDDPLEAGLEIFASPPGKRLQILSLLSGGERAMTALALLFAVFLVNPAPICVLDEVDAPLDDANVDRFCAMLDELTRLTHESGANGTRFLIVTHHRMTMARMDRLFGVTMQERGVSRLVSVDLQTAEALTEPAAVRGS